MVASDLPDVLRALSFAAEKHRDQRRKDDHGSPYINHPIALVRVLGVEAGVTDGVTLCAALLHDTIEDTDTTAEELEAQFGSVVCRIVMEVSDDKRLPKAVRKRLQIERAGSASHRAKLVKLADKICNLRDVCEAPPVGWSLARQQEYFDWARDVVGCIRGAHPQLEQLFDAAYQRRPRGD
jgi:guanosine-3',5'-bis(diphosphate) 3'-pyrophosphohydrolase